MLMASISFEVTSCLGFFLFASSRSCDEKQSKEYLSSPIGTGGSCIHAIDGDFWDSIGCLILAEQVSWKMLCGQQINPHLTHPEG